MKNIIRSTAGTFLAGRCTTDKFSEDLICYLVGYKYNARV